MIAFLPFCCSTIWKRNKEKWYQGQERRWINNWQELMHQFDYETLITNWLVLIQLTWSNKSSWNVWNGMMITQTYAWKHAPQAIHAEKHMRDAFYSSFPLKTLSSEYSTWNDKDYIHIYTYEQLTNTVVQNRQVLQLRGANQRNQWLAWYDDDQLPNDSFIQFNARSKTMCDDNIHFTQYPNTRPISSPPEARHRNTNAAVDLHRFQWYL